MSPTKDRLNDLKRIQNGDIGIFLDEDNTTDTRTKNITRTFNNIEAIRDNIESIRNNTSVSNNIFQSNSFKLSKDLQHQIDSLFHSTTSTAYKINTQIKELENELLQISNKSSTEYRMKQIQFTTLKEYFHKAVEESSACLELQRNNRKDFLKQCLKLVQNDANEEDLEALLDSNQLDVFTGNHLVTTEEAKRQLRDIEERHEELIKIEKNLKEVMNLFVTIATLVEQQQESVNRVEYLATTATDYVEQGTQVLEKSIKTKKKWNKRKIYIIIGIIILLTIVLILIFK